MAMPQQGMSTDEVFARLDEYRQDDLPVKGGRAWGFVYDAGPEVDAVKQRAVVTYLGKNGLDPTVFPSLERLENDILAIARDHLNGGEEVVGTFTSGGTESCMLAVKAARERGRAKGIEEPELLLPVTAHAAFHKGAHYFDVKVVPVKVDGETFKADMDAVKAAVTENTILIVGSASSYAHGVCDPIEEMAALADEKGILCHVDGCIGAFLLPYFKELGADIPAFDFSVKGVTSISMDLHKYAYAPKGASTIIYRDASLRRYQIYACAEWTGYSVVNPTVQSTKSGGPLAGAWAVLNTIGQEGYRQIAKDLLDATNALIEGIEKIPALKILSKPEMSLIAFTSDEVNVFHIVDEMKERGWYVQAQLAFDNSPANIHLTVAPGNIPQVEPLLKDLADSVEAARKLPEITLPESMMGMMSSLDPSQLDDNMVTMMLGMAGIQGTSLPERMAGINTLLNVMPAKLKERLLSEFLNTMFAPVRGKPAAAMA